MINDFEESLLELIYVCTQLYSIVQVVKSYSELKSVCYLSMSDIPIIIIIIIGIIEI